MARFHLTAYRRSASGMVGMVGGWAQECCVCDQVVRMDFVLPILWRVGRHCVRLKRCWDSSCRPCCGSVLRLQWRPRTGWRNTGCSRWIWEPHRRTRRYHLVDPNRHGQGGCANMGHPEQLRLVDLIGSQWKPGNTREYLFPARNYSE